MKLQGKTAIVTGGGAGIGRAIAEAFAREGAQVVIANRTVSTGEEGVRSIAAAGGQAVFVPTDVSQSADVQNLIRQTIAHFGRLNVLVNNAGLSPLSSVTECSEEEWDETLSINLKGPFLCSKYAIPEMLKAGGGSIINIGSVLGDVGMSRQAAYCASKGGLALLTRQMALDYGAQGIRTNCVAPGFIRTQMYETNNSPERKQQLNRLHPVGRVGTPEEVAHMAVFLASDEASFVNGATLLVDGGLLAQCGIPFE
jgi:NAD(P)-dependent dehydrogenase (short-subunit alcohol dehydrogenase family)